jgi:hypothetical protein
MSCTPASQAVPGRVHSSPRRLRQGSGVVWAAQECARRRHAPVDAVPVPLAFGSAHAQSDLLGNPPESLPPALPNGLRGLLPKDLDTDGYDVLGRRPSHKDHKDENKPKGFAVSATVTEPPLSPPRSQPDAARRVVCQHPPRRHRRPDATGSELEVALQQRWCAISRRGWRDRECVPAAGANTLLVDELGEAVRAANADGG